MSMPRPLTATIDLDALRHNLAVARRHAPRSRTLAVIKADAYGHGLLRAARALRDTDGYALVELEGALRLREAGYGHRIVLLEGFFEAGELPLLAEHHFAAVVHNPEQLGMLEGFGEARRLEILLKVNTGMNRLGFAPSEVPDALERLRRAVGTERVGLMTHFANADDARGIGWQMAVFEQAARGSDCPRCLANSAAILRYPETHCDWVRPGIMLYGCSPFAEQVGADFDLSPAMTLEGELIAIQHLRRGDTVGYGGVFTAEREAAIGVVACGYADGYPRHAPSGTPVVVEGCVTGTVGRVSMDMLCVDLSAIPGARVGSRAVLWGAENPIERVAAAAGTVGYELMCALAPRVRIVERGG
jgi:alanine racemase